MKELKVAVICNEPHPEFYIKSIDHELKELDFVPYFEVEELTPVEEYELITEKLRKSGINAYFLNIRDSVNVLIKNLKENKPDVVFNFMEIFKENPALEMNIVGMLEVLNVAYTGASPMTLANCQSKIITKRFLVSAGIRTPKFLFFRDFASKYKHNLKFPLIVKPAFEDASVGIENESIVENDYKLKERIEFIMKFFNQPALVEEFIDGRELNVSVLGDLNPKALPISEINFDQMPGNLYSIVSYQAKWNPYNEAYHKTIPVCPSRLPKRIEEKAKDLAIKAFKQLGCRDYARVDMRLSRKNELYVLEVNPNPDLTEGTGFMRSMEAAGYSYVRSLKKIISLALKRKERQSKIVRTIYRHRILKH